jgi:hypothetical protein
MNKYKVWLEAQITEYELDVIWYQAHQAITAAHIGKAHLTAYSRALEAYNRIYQQEYQASKRAPKRKKR